MGTAAWGGSGEGKCFPCHGLSWWRLLLYFPSQPHRTAVRPKLSAVSVIRLFARTRQPSATLASPLVCMRETTSPALRSVLHKETSRWSAATTPQEPRAQLEEATPVPRVTLRHGSEVLVTLLPMCTKASSLPMPPALSLLARLLMSPTLAQSWSPELTRSPTRFGVKRLEPS